MYISSGIDAGVQQIRGDRVTARRGVAEPKAPGVGENRRVERLRDRRRDLEPERTREVVHQLARGARRDVGQRDRSGRFVGRDVVVDDELRHVERSHGVGEHAKSLHVADVEHDQQIDVAQSRGAFAGVVSHVIAEQEVEQLRPRRGVHDAHIEPALREHARQRRLGAAAVAVGVHVRRQRHAPPGRQLARELADRDAARRGLGIR